MSVWDFMMGSTPAGAAASTAKAVTDGLFSGVDKIIRDFKAPPEAVLQLETLKAQIEAQITNAQMQDMQSARQMQMTTNSKMPALLTIFYTIAFVIYSAIILVAAYAYNDLTFSAFQAGMIGSVWGALASQAALGSNFYLGTSRSSDVKNDTINTLTNQATQALQKKT